MDTIDDQLTIVNRSTEYRISKEKLIRKIPYFEKMLSNDLKESKENKAELDLDEKAFKSIFNWIEHGCIFIEMDFVIYLFDMVDYFGITDFWMDDLVVYFRDNFSTAHLPVILCQVTSTSNLINSGTLNAFICRYFLKIVNTAAWLDYPVETIAYICGLDLMIHSEYQVYDAIMRWVTFKADSNKRYLDRLLKLIRWCDLEVKDQSKIKENEFVKSSAFEPALCSYNKPKRTKQGYFVAIEELSDKNLQIKVLDGDFSPLINQLFQYDQSLPLHLLHDESISDIHFDCGEYIIRIDWKHNKYRFTDRDSHFHKISSCIFENECGQSYIVTKKPGQTDAGCCRELLLLEATKNFILVRNDQYWFRCWETPSIADIAANYAWNGHTYLATILDNRIYMLTGDLEFFQFNIDRDFEFKKIELKKLQNKLKFNNLHLTSMQANDDRVIFVDKITKDVSCFNVSTQKYKSIGRIIDCSSKSRDGQKKSNVLKAFTFGFISSDSINLCLKCELKQ